MSGKIQLFTDKAGTYRWRLKAGNGEIIITGSHSYETVRAARRAIELFRLNAANAGVHDLT